MNNIFKSFITVPNNGVTMVRLSDNVLDSDCWPVAALTSVNGIITEQVDVYIPHSGYGMPKMLGWAAKQVTEWLDYDGTGTYPESFHEGHVLYNADTTAELKLLSGKLLRAVDLFSRPPHCFVQPGLSIVRDHSRIISDLGLFEAGK